MEKSNYWLAVETPETWEDAKRKTDGTIGWSERYRETVEQLEPGNLIFSYMTKRKKFFAVWEVTRTRHYVPKRTLAGKEYPECVGVKVIVPPSPETGIPVEDIEGFIESFKAQKLSGIVRQSLRPLGSDVGEAILRKLSRSSN
jgi:hypothetical protein